MSKIALTCSFLGIALILLGLPGYTEQSQPALQAPTTAAAQTAALSGAAPNASANAVVKNENGDLVSNAVDIKPYRTFVTIQRYNVENNGEVGNPISNVRIEVTWPNNTKLLLPEGGQFWPIGNGQVQEINRTFEIPWAYIQNNGFKFQIQMIRKGSAMLPCNFEVVQLSEFNRAYVCHTDLNWQQQQQLTQEQMDKEGIQVRVFTDRNSQPKEIPSDALALK